MKKMFIIILMAFILSSCQGQVYAGIQEDSDIPVLDGTKNVLPTEILSATSTLKPTNTLQPTFTATLTNTVTVTPVLEIPKILLLGDSMLSLTRVPTFLSERLLNEGYTLAFVGDDYPYDNVVPVTGLGGFDTRRVLKQLTQDDVWTRLNGTQFPNNFESNIPDIVILQLGTNDAVNTVAEDRNPVVSYKKNMQEIISYIRSKNENVKIVLPMLMPSMWPEYTAKIRLINAALPEIANEFSTEKSPVVTTYDLIPNWKFEYFIDNVHPNDKGSRFIAEAYFDALVENGFINK